MCAIVGGIFAGVHSQQALNDINLLMAAMLWRSRERGRDGVGVFLEADGIPIVRKHVTKNEHGWLPKMEPFDLFMREFDRGSLIANLRAEPTTEYVAQKRIFDQQPYGTNGWRVVHNGTIANDKALRTHAVNTDIDSAAIPEVLEVPYTRSSSEDVTAKFVEGVKKLKGSYAILAQHRNFPHQILAAANYRPIWFAKTPYGYVFASSRRYFPEPLIPQMLEPYSVMSVSHEGASGWKVTTGSLRQEKGRRALVVCSGGLDSVVAATYAQVCQNYDVELIHFQYGSRAEGPEVKAVQAVAAHLGVKCTLFPLPIYKPSDSPLLQADSEIAGGEAGAEFAHEWVPARNLLLLSVATAYAEANGFETLVLGNNLEEAGAYPDNEPEFIHRFNDLLPFAVGDGKQLTVEMPVGNMMKHEIVKLGHDLHAPMHLTWSCYRAGSQHCGTCGPCFMRRTAFEINNLPEVLIYDK